MEGHIDIKIIASLLRLANRQGDPVCFGTQLTFSRRGCIRKSVYICGQPAWNIPSWKFCWTNYQSSAEYLAENWYFVRLNFQKGVEHSWLLQAGWYYGNPKKTVPLAHYSRVRVKTGTRLDKCPSENDRFSKRNRYCCIPEGLLLNNWREKSLQYNNG